MVSIQSDPSSYYEGPKKSSKFLTHFARRLRIGKGSSKSKSATPNGGGVLEQDSEEDRQGDTEEIVILRGTRGGMTDETLTGGSSGAESPTVLLVVPTSTAAILVPPVPPFKRGNSFRQSLNYLLKRTRHKATERSCTSDSDVVHELDEDAATLTRSPKRPVLDAFLPEQLPTKRHSTGDIFNEDLDADIRAQELRVQGAGRHRRVHSDSTSYDLTGKKGKKATHAVLTTMAIGGGPGQPKSANNVGLGTRPLPISSTIEPLTSLESSGLPEASAHLNVLSRSPSHSTSKSDPKSLKSLSPSARSSTIRSSSPHPLKSFSSTRDTVDKPEKSEKHHKKKESGISWEQKKFAQHFAQVPDDEVVLDYFSCALVGDILLQGYLYITQNYFAFYSNVFGYVTKLLIPTISVLDISREKTAYMFPNAVGVKTRDDRHVFGSFLSREAAYYLMCSVWDRATNPNTSDSFSTIQQHSRLATLHAEGSEGSLDEDSSCYDGNESSFHGKDEIPDMLDSGDSNDSTTRLKQKKHKKELLLKSPAIVKSPVILKAAVGAGGLPECLKVDAKTLPTLSTALAGGLIGDGGGVSRGGTGYGDPNANGSNSSSSSSGASGSRSTFSKIKEKLQHILPSDFGIIHIGILLTVLLALFSCFLAYKIYALQARLSAPRIRLGDDTDFYLDVLRWQKRLHSKSKEEAQLVLNSNLEQIVRVRKSLETLSILLQDAPSPLDASGVLADLRDGDGGIVGNDPPSDDSIAGSIMAAAAAAARSTILGDSGSINQQYFHEDAT
ncbi:uncharacterized protein LOC118459606 isoform X2 [Anopheles albimanus]|uniref:uncharacterized protein LOC118459606 isoform X2 n=1 Tax=Anopheles albimanus TaxID=7167 RepID=UPI00163FF551|nr:uncharacterized protein LOC118459606 isoform X2 [Anopheles albimanus]